MNGVVVKVLAGIYTVCTETGYLNTVLKGRLKLDEYPVVGDLVKLERTNNLAVILEILPRRNLLDRPRIANIDQLFIFNAAALPSPQNYLIDRLTVLGEYWKLKTVIGFNKADLNRCHLADSYRLLGYRVYEFSLLKEQEFSELKSILKDQITVLAGPSGVGKTTFVNKILEQNRKTGMVSEKTRRGQHTTREVELLKLPFGGYIADTPGFSRLDVYITDPYSLSNCFVEMQGIKCRFQNCLHLKEPDCQVRDKIDPLRYQSYVELLAEIKERKPW